MVMRSAEYASDVSQKSLESISAIGFKLECLKHSIGHKRLKGQGTLQYIPQGCRIARIPVPRIARISVAIVNICFYAIRSTLCLLKPGTSDVGDEKRKNLSLTWPQIQTGV